jgi:hypothetical protein
VFQVPLFVLETIFYIIGVFGLGLDPFMGFPPSNGPFLGLWADFFPRYGHNFPLFVVILGGIGARMASIFIYLGVYFAVFGGFCPVFGRELIFLYIIYHLPC